MPPSCERSLMRIIPPMPPLRPHTRSPLYHGFLLTAVFAPSQRCISASARRSDASTETCEVTRLKFPNPRPRKPLTKEQRDFLSSAVSSNTPGMLRVNQTGELAATLIYTAQTPPLVNAHPHLRPLMAHMYDQEAGHLRTFNSLITKHRVRPTALYPLWSMMATGLGWATAIMGREAAMACTEAVETEIGEHYNNQIRSLLEMFEQWEAEGYEVGPEFRDLISTLRRIRDEELEHLDHAIEHDAKDARPYWLLTSLIRAGCRGAIWTSERV